jgi:dihydrofolate synthase/folylpolyglutamate synthase
VTGTNGKGSVCKFIGSILQIAGYTVGVYISPHLQRFSERIVLNGEEISEEEIVVLVQEVKPIVEQMIQENNTPTFFEIVTAMAFLYFSNKNVDFAVIEVGLGGRFDATNVITPLVSIITNVSKEHSEQLGEDISSIAFEKAGIIKPNIPVVTAASGVAKTVIQKVAKQNHASVIHIDDSLWKRVTYSMQSQEFLIHGILQQYKVQTSMLGKYQGENIAVSIAAIEQLHLQAIHINHEAIVEGIVKGFNPGRMELVSKEPFVLLDGAHNPAGMKMLSQTLQNDFEYQHLILMLAILQDKDIPAILDEILPLAEVIVLTKSHNPRACDEQILAQILLKMGVKKQVVLQQSIPQALEYAKSIAAHNDLLCVTGSLFTVGEARNHLLALCKV